MASRPLFISLFAILIFLFSLKTQAEIKLVIQKIPDFTPNNAQFFVLGSFNNWKQADAKYKFIFDSTSKTWTVALPNTLYAFEYKFSRGDSSTVEVDTNGKDIPNRVYIAPTTKPDTILLHSVSSWKDQNARLTFRVLKVPENTPEDSKLYISGNFVDFNSAHPNCQLVKVNGYYKVSIPAFAGDSIIYKFTRGTWGTVEGGYSGGFRPNRFYLRKTNEPETIDVVISSWEDLSDNVLNLFSFTGLLLSSLGLIVAVMLMSIDREGYTFTRPLLIIITTYSTAFFIKVATDSTFIFDLQPRLYLAPELVWFTFAPLFYFFVRLMTKRDVDEEIKFNWKSLIPFGLHLLAIAPVLLLNDNDFKNAFVNQTYQPWFGVLGGLAIVFNAFWWGKTMLHLKKSANYGKEAVPLFRLSLLFKLQWLYFTSLLVWFLTYIISVVDWWFKLGLLPITDIGLKIVWLLFCLPSIFITYFSLKYPELFKRKRTGTLPSSIQKTKDDSEGYLFLFQDKLERIMENEAIYANPILSIKDIALSVGTNTHTLSNIINDKYQKNFNDFVNSYRVKAFIKKMGEVGKDKNFTELAYEVGFNSKATFNRAFKKATGFTPSEYFNKTFA